jgi:pimeloyl-ACP methyl ester carboxylesterase
MDVELPGDGVMLAGTEVGEGPTVLLLHAGGERRSVWEPVVTGLAPRGYRCVAVDQRGHGASPAAGADSLDRLGADVVVLCEGSGPPVVLVGASLGGFAALVASAARPALVAGLVLVDVVPDPEPTAVRAVLADTVIHGVVGGAHRVLVDDILGRSDELRGALARVRAPVLLVRGTVSPLGRDAGSTSRFHALAPHAEVVDVAGAGHLVARDRPAELARVLAGFLDRVAVRRSAAHGLLVERGSAAIEHLGGDLLTHLEGTEAMLRAWSATEDVALAGLCHAVYGTAGFAPHLLALTERSVLRRAIGTDAEQIAYRYASCARDAVYPGLGRRPLVFTDRFTDTRQELSDADARAFALVTAANELDLINRAVLAGAARTEVIDLLQRLVPYAPDVLEAAVPPRA